MTWVRGWSRKDLRLLAGYSSRYCPASSSLSTLRWTRKLGSGEGLAPGSSPCCGAGAPPNPLTTGTVPKPACPTGRCPVQSSPPCSVPGTVAVTHLLAYLEAVTGQGPQDVRLQTLARSLDPYGKGDRATVELDTFLVVMRDWIAACQLHG